MTNAQQLTERITPDIISRVTAGRRTFIPESWNSRIKHYLRVPKDLGGNLAYRKRILETAAKDERVQEVLLQMCAEDFLFWVNSFCWTYANKDFPDAPNRPFVTYPFQDIALLEIDDAISGRHPLHICKSRDMGATWQIMMVFLWRILFKRGQTFACISRKQDLVDRLGDEDTLFAKFDYAMKYLPKWMYAPIDRKILSFRNEQTGSGAQGDSTTGDSFRGGRRNGLFADEMQTVENDLAFMAAISAVTDCKIYNGTPAGMANEFYRLIARTDHRLELHWTLHPLKMQGAYELGGKIRSPWFDKMAKELHPITLAQEVEMNFIGSAQRYFREDMLGPYIQQFAMPPLWVGDIEFKPDGSIKDMVQNPSGKWRFWQLPDAQTKWPDDRIFVAACDIAFGTGASNSTCVVGDAKERIKIAEYADANIDPGSFAKLVVNVCRWFRGYTADMGPEYGGAYLIWENNGGGGSIFGQEVVRQNYRNVYFSRKEGQINRPVTVTAGWNSNSSTRKLLLGGLFKAYSEKTYINPSTLALDEARCYVFVPSAQAIVHTASMDDTDPSGAGSNHGDRVIADALLVLAMDEIGEIQAPQMRAPPGSYAADVEERNRRAAAEDYWSPESTIFSYR